MDGSTTKDVANVIGGLTQSVPVDAPISAKIRNSFKEIEEAQRKGYSLKAIAKSLSDAGHEISAATLQTTMSRVRKERGEAKRNSKNRTAKAAK